MRRFAVFALLAACYTSPADRCDAYIDLLCERVAECGMLVEGEQTKCVDLASAAMSCTRVSALGSGYDTCIDKLESGPCEDFLRNGSTYFEVPVICHSAFEYDDE